MLTRMTDTPNSDLRTPVSAEGSSVLANLPRTRPQRASARRARARTGAQAGASAPSARDPAKVPGVGGPHARKARAPVKASTARSRRSGPAPEPVPPQGYESDGDSLHGPIQPPGGAELVSSIAELAGELAKAGVSAGAHLVKGLFSRLPG